MATTRTHFDQELEQLKSGVFRMGSMVEQAIGHSMEALVQRDNALARAVIRGDEELNELHRELRERSFMIMATQQPVARDLRLIFSFQHMVIELERMGDHAVNIARGAIRLNDLPQLKPYIDLPRMAALVQSQVHDVLGAVIDADQDRARKIAERDDEVDTLYRSLWDELVEYMVNDPGNVQRAAILLFIAKDLERIADRVTNIAEDVVFLHTGHIVELS
ncbi:MAG TPA: phosphate signaling complex protein PhoU [Candidatus Limnocylindrales bacterium]|nr:phosphate signaling complex protein PhoU [Candidatus Limnocylindrales bacterium]